MSLRVKLMLAQLCTGLAAVVLIGGLAYMRAYYKVDSLRREQAVAHFHSAVTAYLGRYGSWQAGMATAPFHDFMRTRSGPQASSGSDGRPGEPGGPDRFGRPD